MIKTELLFGANEALLEFIHECDKLGFKNNNSLEAMNFFKTITFSIFKAKNNLSKPFYNNQCLNIDY